MLEPPDLSDEAIIASVRASYDITVAALTFLPIGNDSSTWVYRLQAANGITYFLKVRKGIGDGTSVIVPRYLRDHGVTQVAAPLPTTTQALWVDVNQLALTIYPFIDGVTGRDHGMTEQHWITYGAALRQIHATALPPDLMRLMKHEAFTPTWSGVVTQLEEHITTHVFADPAEQELATFWRVRRAEIRALIDRAEALGQRLRVANPPLALCHADAHTWNVMIDTADRFWLVDWDETILAPKERDLMFVVGGIGRDLVRPHEEAWFRAGYGDATVDPLALAYYRYAWAIGDIGSYAERVFLMPEAGVATKRAAVQGAMSCFQPGSIVALAYEADRFQA